MLAALALTLAPTLLGAPIANPDLQTVDYPAKGGQVVTYSGPGEVIRLRPFKLSGEALSEFNGTFTELGYFGAFAISPDGGYGYATSAGTLAAAREIAMAQCAALNQGCEIVAEYIPAGYVEPGSSDITLSREMTENYTAPDRGSFVAMAASEDGGWAMGWDYPSQAEANDYAINECEMTRLDPIPGVRDMPCILLPGL
jgi:hypothetical protein